MSVALTNELWITSFKNFWFLSTHYFLKHIRVVRDARIITFLIGEKRLSHGGVRFFITYLPHAHLNPFEVHKRNTSLEGGCHTIKAKLLLKSIQTDNAQAPELTGFVWNVSNTNPCCISRNLYFMVTHEEPKLLMVLGAQLGEDVIKTVNALGFKHKISNGDSGSWMHAVTIFW